MNDDAEAAEPAEPPVGDAPAGRMGDPLVEALERLRAAEDRRREVPRESAEFNDRARDVEVRAREVFRLAELEPDRRPPDEPAAGDEERDGNSDEDPT